jgi:diguanylate cyclase (GGDEF)-like protein
MRCWPRVSCRLRRLTIPYLAVLAFVSSPASVAAQAVEDSPYFTHLSVADGLSQSSVEHILQDKRGFFWFGTQEGLNRYDGYRFTVHRAHARDGFLGDHEIRALIEDRHGDLWVGTARGLYRYALATGRFDRRAAAAAHLTIVDLVEADDGRIYFASSDGRLWAVDADGAAVAVLPSDVRVTTLARAEGGAIWAAGSGALIKVESRAANLSIVQRDLGAISTIATDHHGDIWIGRQDDDLLRYRTKTASLDRFPTVPRPILTILPSRLGVVWIGARAGGLSRLDPASGAVTIHRRDPEDPASLARDDVAAIYEDAVGSLWVGMWNGGVNRLDPDAQAFHTFRYRPRVPDSLPADDVSAMTELADGSLWMATRSGLVVSGEPRLDRFRTVARIRDRRLVSIGSLGDRVVVGTARGLVALDRASGMPVALDAPLLAERLDEIAIGPVRVGTGGTWIAAGPALFHASAPGQPIVRRFSPPVTRAISALSVERQGRVWIGTEAGDVVLAAAGPDGVSRFEALRLGTAADASPAHGHISSLHEDRHGQLWIGTRRGLGRVDLTTGRAVWIGQEDGLPSTNIAGIAEDAEGRLWIGTNRGLTRIDSSTGAMMHFGEREGAQGRGGYAEGAWTTGGSGTIYFAGAGITAFDPREVRVSGHPPTIAFTALEILHRLAQPRWLDPSSPLDGVIEAQSSVTLGPGASVFSVEMAPLHYADPGSNRIAYRLEGFDSDWIEATAHNRIATYTRLAPGRYVLRARAGTKNGVWSRQEATLAIEILPPWWRTNTAMAASAVLTLAVGGLVFYAARQRARVKMALLERETLRRESLTDPLTGLYNRRFLTTYLQHEVPKVLREHEAGGTAAARADLLLLLVDVDHFKTINDRSSHAAGDRALARIASVLRQHIRDSDLAVRWGGDEFLVLARSVHRARAAESAERLRAAIEALGAHARPEDPPCTVSIGFASFPFLTSDPKALTWEQTLELADHALRSTKHRRRNSYTGLRASAGLRAADVEVFLAAGSGAPIPDGIDVIMPPDSGRSH